MTMQHTFHQFTHTYCVLSRVCVSSLIHNCASSLKEVYFGSSAADVSFTAVLHAVHSTAIGTIYPTAVLMGFLFQHGW